MDLWVRTQDKRQLLKVNDGLYIANGFTDTNDTFIGIKNVGHIGRYTKEERALEILDEIQDVIYMKQLFNADADRFATCLEEDMNMSEEDMNLLVKQISVYKMPKE